MLHQLVHHCITTSFPTRRSSYLRGAPLADRALWRLGQLSPAAGAVDLVALGRAAGVPARGRGDDRPLLSPGAAMSLWPAIALVLLVAIAILWRFAKPSGPLARSEEHTSELQSLMRISSAVFCLKKKIYN